MRGFLEQLESDERVFGVKDERAYGDGVWVELERGYWNADDEVHFIHEDTHAKCASKLSSVERCSCVACRWVWSDE